MSRRRKNTFAKAISHIKSTKFDMVEDAPTNRTSGFMTITPNSPNPDYVPPHYPAPEDLPDFSIDGEDGKDTTGLFKSDGITPRTALPPITESSPDRSYILGPMASMWYAWANSTRIGYIRQADRKMVNLGAITGKLSDWDGASNFTSYGQMTLEQAVWFKNVEKAPGQNNNPDTANYRAFYPGPPSNSPDAFGRYYCTITGEGLDSPRTAEGEPMIPPGQGEMSPEDIFAAIMDRLMKGKRLSEAEKQWLRDHGLDDFADGGNTGSPIGDLIALGLSYAAVKALIAFGPQMAKATWEMIKADWKKRIIDKASFDELEKTGKIPKGAKWEGWKAFTPKFLKTGPTQAAELAVKLAAYIENLLKGKDAGEQNKIKNKLKNDKSYQDQVWNSIGGSNSSNIAGGVLGPNTPLPAPGWGKKGNFTPKPMWNKPLPGGGTGTWGTSIKLAHREPQGKLLSESKRSIIKNLKKPVVIPETKQKKYKVKPKIRGIENSAIISKPIETPKEYQPKGGRNLWGQYEYQRNVIQSQERKNEVLNLIGEGEQAFRHMLTNSKKLNAEEMEKFWGLHPDMHSHFYGGKKYKVTRKEQIHGDYLVFLVDEDGVKSNILQSKLNEKLAEEEDKRILDEYNKINPKPKRNDRISYEKDPLFKKVYKKLKNEIDYPDKPAKMGYPNDPPPKMVDGWHPEYGKRYKYDKLDPVSAVMMKKAPTGDPEIDANVTKAAKKPK